MLRANVDHLGFLLQLCELGLIERERKSGKRRLKSARFPAYKTLYEFDFDARPSVNKPLVLELARRDYLDQRQNLLFVGNSGKGKTHLATGLAVIACAQGKRIRFWRVTARDMPKGGFCSDMISGSGRQTRIWLPFLSDDYSVNLACQIECQAAQPPCTGALWPL